MTPRDLQEWMDRHDLTAGQVAEFLGQDRKTIDRYLEGELEITPRVALACRTLDPMKLYWLAPVDTNHNDWRASSHRGIAVVRAQNETLARWHADKHFRVSARRRREGGDTPKSPWLKPERVTITETHPTPTWSTVGEPGVVWPAAERCVFCGGTNLSKQHVFPNWAKEYLEAPVEIHHFTFRRSETVDQGDQYGLVVTDTDLKARPGQLNQVKIRKYCQACNNGWMSAIENEAKPIASLLLKGEACILDDAAQTKLARWLTLMLIVIESGDLGSATLAESAVKQFYLDPSHSALSHGQFYIGYQNASDWHCKMWHQAECVNSNSCTMQVTTIGMGHLLVHLFSSELPASTLSYGPIRNMQQIWPITQPSIAWPLPYTWNDASASKLAHELHERLMKLSDRKVTYDKGRGSPQMLPPKLATSPAATRREVRNVEFNSQKIRIDGNTYVGCVFTKCVLEFGATNGARFIECTFKDTMPELTSGAAQADLTLTRQFLDMLCQAGGRWQVFALRELAKLPRK